MGAAAAKATSAIVPVSIMPGLYVGIFVFLVGIVIIYQNRPQSGYWASWQCDGEPCDETNAPSILTIVGLELLASAVIAFLIGSGVYKMMFYAKNPKLLALVTAEQDIAEPILGTRR